MMRLLSERGASPSGNAPQGLLNAGLGVMPGAASYRFTLARRKYGKPSPELFSGQDSRNEGLERGRPDGRCRWAADIGWLGRR